MLSAVLIVTVNSGSTSIKLAAFEIDPRCGELTGKSDLAADSPEPNLTYEPLPHRIAAVRHEGTHLEPVTELKGFIEHLPNQPAAFVHRVVHGGNLYTRSVRIDAQVRRGIDELSVLAPLHNPLALRWIDAAVSLCETEQAQVAVFDTAFYAQLPAVAAEYALPRTLGRDAGVRRYGFHGLAHQAMWHRWCQLNPKLPGGGRLISLLLGGGCSITATDRGRARDTSMGFSPLEGLVMATRSGDIDPAVVPYLAERLDVSPRRLIESFNREAGLLGLAGRSNPAELIAEDTPQARLAVQLYCYRIRKYIGAYLAVLGGCDGIVFGGGVGEHVPQVRAIALAGMSWAGIALDPKVNTAAVGRDARISAAASPVAVWTVTVDEEPLMVREAIAALGT